MGVLTKMTSQQDVRVPPDKSFNKTTLRPGTGLVRPNEGSTCNIRITKPDDLTLDDTLIGYPLGDETTIKLGDGEGELSHIIDTCLEMMLPGELCQIEVAIETLDKIVGKKTRISNGRQDLENNICETLACIHQTVAFEIELNSFTRNKDIFEMTLEDRLDRAVSFKTKGSNCFGCGKVGKAEMFYLRAVKYVITVDPLDIMDASDETRTQLNTLKCACLLNIAACKLKFKRFEHVISHCTKVLAINKDNVKGLFRRGMAYMELQEYEKSKEDFDHALRLQPTSKPLKQQRQVLHERIKKT